jgi:hypothetical protein
MQKKSTFAKVAAAALAAVFAVAITSFATLAAAGCHELTSSRSAVPEADVSRVAL